jgi:hypothetical protein
MESFGAELHDAIVTGLQIGRPEGTMRLYFDKLGKGLVFSELTFLYFTDVLTTGILFDVKVHRIEPDSEESVRKGNELLAQLAGDYRTTIPMGSREVFLTELSSSFGLRGVALPKVRPDLVGTDID